MSLERLVLVAGDLRAVKDFGTARAAVVRNMVCVWIRERVLVGFYLS